MINNDQLSDVTSFLKFSSDRNVQLIGDEVMAWLTFTVHDCELTFLFCLILLSDPICPPSVPEILPASNQNSPGPKMICKDPLSDLEKCFDPRCSERNSSQTCEGVVGCYWCKNDKDDVPLKQPYCASSEVCYRGREGNTMY